VPLLDLAHLSVSFHTRAGIVRAVDSVSFSVAPGETLGIVGESGSGKSVCCLALLGLLPRPPAVIESGSAHFEGKDLLALNERTLRTIRGRRISMIFQDPMTCLNPCIPIGEQLIEPLLQHRNTRRRTARQQAIALLDEVGIPAPERRYRSWPHELSGGMRQRVMIAMALIAEPALLIADEPTTALDVSIQKQILELIKAIQSRRNLGLIFVSHDLAVVRNLADQVLVMEQGRAVEQGAAEPIFNRPQQPYTQKLLAAIPRGSKTTSPTETAQPVANLLEVRTLTTRFTQADSKQPFTAVNSVDFDIRQGEILGLVGESGSGKSTLGRSILNLVRPDSGSVRLRGQQLMGLNRRQMRPLRAQLQMIFQDPYASLNPRMSVFATLAEPLRLHRALKGEPLASAVGALLEDVGLPPSCMRKYPHEFSGGQRQRIAIGRALASQPTLVVADEPVSALDVSIQKQILELLLRLVARHNLSMLFISHDLAVVRALCDRVLVMHRGQIVEQGPTEAVWTAPRDPYTRALIAAVPRL